MALLIDPPSWPGHGRLWSHLVSDVSFDELHVFARGLGVPERGFEGDHYDLPEEYYPRAVAAGAVPVPSRELLRRLHQAGLRRPKRTGERVVGSRVLGDGVTRIDTLWSTKPPRRRPSGVVLLATGPADPGRAGGGQVLALPGGEAPARSLDVGELPEAVVAALAAAVLTARGRRPVPRQIGYLRALGPEPGDVRIDVVLHLDGDPHEPRSPAGWADPASVARARPALAPLLSRLVEPLPRR